MADAKGKFDVDVKVPALVGENVDTDNRDGNERPTEAKIEEDANEEHTLAKSQKAARNSTVANAAPPCQTTTTTTTLNPHQRPSTRSNRLPSPFINLHVGGPASPSHEPVPTTFRILLPLLTFISPFFHAAFSPTYNFYESRSRSMVLPDIRVDDMRLLLQWLQANTGVRSRVVFRAVPPPPPADTTSPGQCLHHPLVDPPLAATKSYLSLPASVRKTTPRPHPPCLGPLIRLYVLADRFSMHGSALPRQICRRVKQVCVEAKCVPSVGDVDTLWNGVMRAASTSTAGGDTDDLKKVVLDLFVASAGTGGCDGILTPGAGAGGGGAAAAAGNGNKNSHRESVGADYHPDFLWDLLVAFIRRDRKRI